MAPQSNGTDPQRNSEASVSPLERRTPSSLFSAASKRLSAVSTETAESSSAASQRNGFATNGHRPRKSSDMGQEGKQHRSHKSRSGGGFLLTNTARERSELDHAQRTRTDQKGKAAGQGSEEKRHRRPEKGTGVGGSPLATTVTNAAEQENGESSRGNLLGPSTNAALKPMPAQLDIDPAQIVNLALNLNESRNMTTKRHLPSSMSPATGDGESTTGGSLKYHLQQQRRISRTISPKSERADRAVIASPRLVSGARMSASLQGSFHSAQEGGYRYHFSPSTMARAEKAKKEFELMAQYRRLLSYVPPLRPQVPDRTQTAVNGGTSASFDQSTLHNSGSTAADEASGQLLGREYNPLQYIRNRRLRLRERCGIDSEIQGFGDLETIIPWVDEVARQVSFDTFRGLDYVPLPNLFDDEDTSNTPHTSSKSIVDKTKSLRPRLDWMIKSSDLLADIFWLEQDDNKKRIEDRKGHKVFPTGLKLNRFPWSGHGELELRRSVSPEKFLEKSSPGQELRLNPKLPDFRSVKPSPEGIYNKADRAVTKARDRLRGASHIHHGQNASVRVHRPFLRSHSKSDSYDSDSDSDKPKRYTTGRSQDPAHTLLEKQLSNLIAQEYGKDGLLDSQIDQREGTASPLAHEDSPKRSYEDAISGQSKTSEESRRVQSTLGSPVRKSFEYNGKIRRQSLEDSDITAPNSPEAKGPRTHVPSIAMDLSSMRKRSHSISRGSLTDMKTKTALPDPSNERRRSFAGIEDEPIATVDWTNPNELTQESTGPRTRSNSPAKSLTHRETNSSYTSTTSAKSSRRKGNDRAGIRALFKGSRGPITRVSDLLSRKDASPVQSTRFGFLTDDSDAEDGSSHNRAVRDQSGSRRRNSSEGFPELPTYLDEMPTFLETRGRRSSRPGEIPRAYNRDDDKTTPRLFEGPPSFNIQDASPPRSPDTQSPARRWRDSSVSDVESIKGAHSKRIKSADARLNAILRLSGHVGTGPHSLPITGLAHLEATQKQRPPHPRQWSITDRSSSPHHGRMTKRQIAHVRTLLLSSGIKAREIARRAAEPPEASDIKGTSYKGVATLIPMRPSAVPRSQEHIRAAQLLCDDIDCSSAQWRSHVDGFYNSAVQGLLGRIDVLQKKVAEDLTPMTTQAIDDADEVNRDLVVNRTLEVQRLLSGIESMLRRRRKRLRWARRGGWVLIEWMLVGFMWYVWFVVMVGNAVMSCGRMFWRSARWLLWL